MTTIFDFLCWVLAIALLVMFIRTLAIKWGILEWLQVHAPNDFLYKLFSCDFCQSFHLGMIICIFLAIFAKDWLFLLIPIFSCNIRW